MFSRFEGLKRKIERKYDETERALIEEFSTAQRRDDFKRMKEIASVLSQFKGYPQCVDAYIERSQAVCYLHCSEFKIIQSYLIILGLPVK